MIYLAEVFLVVVYNLSILAGTAYLVQWCNWSGWWFLFAILLLGNTRKESNEKPN